MKTPKMTMAIPYDEVRLQQLKDPKRAQFAFKLALEEFEQDNDIAALLDTLRLIAQAQGGLTLLSRRTDVSRQTLNEALSSRGNPKLKTFQGVLGALGLRMSLKPLKPHKPDKLDLPKDRKAVSMTWGSDVNAVNREKCGVQIRKVTKSAAFTETPPSGTKKMHFSANVLRSKAFGYVQKNQEEVAKKSHR